MRRPPETLEGPSLVLRRVSAQYASELSSAVARSLPELRLFMDWAQHDPATPEAFAEFLEASDREWESDRAYGYHVFVAATDELIGGCGLMRRRGPGAIEIGLIRSTTPAWSAAEAAAILVETAWQLADVCRIVIRHDSANPASGRVAGVWLPRDDRVAVEITAEGESGIDVIRGESQSRRPPHTGRAFRWHRLGAPSCIER